MRVGDIRPLTAGEIAFARPIFHDELALERVRLFQAPAFGFGAMVPFGRTIIFSRWRAPRDFSFADVEAQGWLLHELTHCWQAAHGRILAAAKLKALGVRAYAFALGGRFEDYNIEQQAEIVRSLYLARAGALSIASVGELEALWAQRNGPNRPQGR